MRAPDALPDTGLKILRAQFPAFEVFVHQFIIGLGNVFDQDIPIFFNRLGHIGWNIDCFCNLFLIIVRIGFHGGQINHPGEAVLGADGEGAERDLPAQTLPDAFDSLFKIRPFPVHPADEEKTGKIEFIRVFPDLFRLKFDAPDGIDEDHRPVNDSEAALRIKSEIGIARGVDEVDPVLVPIDMVCGGADGDMSLLFLRLIIHRRGSLVDAAGPIRLAGEIEKGFAERGFSRSSMADDGQIPYRF